MNAVDKVRTKLPNTSWDDLWKDGLTPWDLGKPTPLLISELERAEDTLETEVSRFRSLIPGCGGGYDLLTLHKHHTAILSEKALESVVVGLDLSAAALTKAKESLVAGANHDGLTRIDLNVEISLTTLQCGAKFTPPAKWTQYPNLSRSLISFSIIPSFALCLLTFVHSGAHKWRSCWIFLQVASWHLCFPSSPMQTRCRGRLSQYRYKITVSVLEPHGIVMDGRAFWKSFDCSKQGWKGNGVLLDVR